MRFPTYPVSGEPLRASWGREIVDFLRSITPKESPEIYPQIGASGTTFWRRKRDGKPGVGLFLKAFSCIQTGNNTITVLGGDIYIHDGQQGYSIHAIATELYLTGDPCWVYVEWQRGGSSATIKKLNAQPSSSSGKVCGPLVKYTMTGPNIYTVLPGDLKYDGDFHFDVPVRGGATP